MKLSIFLLVIDLIIWGVIMFTYVITNELAIGPLSCIKRNLLVNMSKRKVKAAFGPYKEDKEAINETNLEEDNNTMKKLEKIIFKFRFKYTILFLLVMLLSLIMTFIFPNHLDVSTILVCIVVTCCIIYVLTKFMSQREDMKEASYAIISKKLNLDDKLMKIIKDNEKN